MVDQVVELKKNMFEERAERFLHELQRDDLNETERELLSASLKKLQNASRRRALIARKQQIQDQLLKANSSSEGDC